ncbi:MAG TPA: peptidylprolyl isomerase [Ornithinimicrobium sp.]|uniref:peptidylprolyl isomerase n=1 Tax=Ornithinimicrobium sp. TaxID=1977084 RepID=UPI002B47B304|nr:peptidylprolyl isomerase [Ornithinimicrobium sp.]HKJ11779.1 peptidylprolyl isomerase [Ornithinimicrobium sp.]
MTRRSRGFLTVMLGAVLLTGCTFSSDAAPESDAEQADQGPEQASGSGLCDEPPPLPSDVPTFRSTQAPSATAPDEQVVTVETNCGPITLTLNGADAPQTVASFLLLSKGDYWVDSPCHRLVDSGIHVLQCGDPTGTGRGGPGYTFGIENAPPNGTYPRGTVAMARSQDPDSNGGQFFVVFDDTELPVAGGGYTIFGRVTGGMDIVDHIADQGVDGGGTEGPPAQPISIVGIDIEGEASS